MERDCSNPFIPSQEHEIPISTPDPDFSIWGVNFDQILFHNDPTNLGGKKMGEGDLQVIEDSRINEEVEKKKVHKEIERQRRQEMAALYDSLRSVLPSKSIKGLRSASDQIAGATKYIRYMQNKVRQLKVKRDKMMKSAENSKGLPISVRVKRCTGSAGVLIFATAEGRSLRLSRVLQVLVEEGLDVVDCNCTKFDGRLHCTIQCEDGGLNIDVQTLQVKLTSNIENFGDESG
ncbi:transcription factor bHLH36-like [Salvia splendens]|uniref:transcription factor bHLH36-like n=1 Tax=Salvia splendens TaxID=180675 RepID=UPI001C26F81B|nr:transcription factor bHLH36-like [Salvia splendens]